MSEESFMLNGLRVTAAQMEEMIGPDWRELNVGEWLARIRDSQARLVAGHDQVVAEFAEMKRYSEAVQREMIARGAEYVGDIADEVAVALYGGHTPITLRVLRGVAAAVEADET